MKRLEVGVVHYTVPDNRAFITKGKIQMSAKKTETFVKLERFFKDYTLSAQYDETTPEPIAIIKKRANKD